MRLRFLHIIIYLAAGFHSFAHHPDHGSSFRFIENKNQWEEKVRYRADIESGTLFLEKNCFTYHLMDGKIKEYLHLPKVPVNPDTLKIRGHAFKVNFENSNSNVVINPEGEFPDYYNYFQGSDRSKWASKAKAFSIVNYQNLYDGIDLKIYSQGNNLKYDFIIFPNVDPSLIQVRYDGIDKMFLREGNLVLQTSLGEVTERKPFAYQYINGRTVPVTCNYILEGHHLSFALPSGYNRNYKLIIDPVLIFSTYSGSTADNFGYTATPDADGFLYSGSSIFNNGYPVTVGAYQQSWAGGTGWFGLTTGVDIAITKYDTTGTFRIYSTYLGGKGEELPHSLIVNENKELFILGTTGSDNFPFVNGFDSTFGEQIHR
jgi:hypothetical protein